MDEIERCIDLSAGLNFIYLVGNRYGYMYVPLQIEQLEFEKILAVAREEKIANVDLMEKWFQLDQNSLPPKHVYVVSDHRISTHRRMQSLLSDSRSPRISSTSKNNRRSRRRRRSSGKRRRSCCSKHCANRSTKPSRRRSSPMSRPPSISNQVRRVLRVCHSEERRPTFLFSYTA